ncbi:MAG: nucleotidyltransferase domain-containing protein [Spirochaetaceae bacterium]|nr:nucleotidyltransferase domain-containing protein [Spirochaetaceae bacterium]
MDRADLLRALEESLPAFGVRRAFLFGSWARGTATRTSDVDLVVIKETDERFVKRAAEFDALSEAIGTQIDVLVYTEAEWESVRSRPFFRDVERLGAALNVS